MISKPGIQNTLSRGKRNERRIIEPKNGRSEKRIDKSQNREEGDWENETVEQQSRLKPIWPHCNPIISARQAVYNCSLVPISTRRPVTAGKPLSAG